MASRAFVAKVAIKYKKKYGVELDPEPSNRHHCSRKDSAILPAMLGPGDTAIVPDPAFPIHIYAVAMAGAKRDPRAARQTIRRFSTALSR